MRWVDLHVHSFHSSDGDWSPAALVETLARRGAAGLALTDHETTAGVPEALAAGADLSVTVVPGVEITVLAQGRELHILGYWFPLGDPAGEALLRRARACRWERALQRIERIRRWGYEIDPEEVGYGTDVPPPTGPRLAQVVLQKPQNYDRYLRQHPERAGASMPLEVAFYRDVIRGEPEPAIAALPAEEVLAGLRSVGAVPVLAHPGAFHFYAPDDLIRSLVPLGLRGIEVFSTYHDEVERDRLQALATRLGLVMTGGSDFHGATKPHVQLGKAHGVPAHVLDQLRG